MCIADTSAPQSAPQSCSQAQDPGLKTQDPLSLLLTTALTPFEIAEACGLTLAQLIEWHDSPQTQAIIAGYARLNATKADALRARLSCAALITLGKLSESSAENPETARKAAGLLLRAAPRAAKPKPDSKPDPKDPEPEPFKPPTEEEQEEIRQCLEASAKWPLQPRHDSTRCAGHGHFKQSHPTQPP